MAIAPRLQGWRNGALTEQVNLPPQAGSPSPEDRAPAHRALRTVWRALFPLRFAFHYIRSRAVWRLKLAGSFIATHCFRVVQAGARLFGHRLVLMSDVKKISMLSVPVLKRLKQVAAEGEGGILEVGPYVGGSTIAFALGHKGKRKHVVVEVGGRNDNPHLPSTDIIRDLKRNLKRFGCEEWVTIVQGWSNDPAVIGPAMEKTGPIGIFFFDANGEVAEQLSISAKHFRDDCTIVLDDMVGDHVKAEMVAPVVHRLEKSGAFVDGELVEGTWFGKLGKLDPGVFAHYSPEQGHGWLMPAPDPARWRVELFEDDKPLGPAGSLHADIRERGRGAWSHWDFGGTTRVMFSTSDNSDPNTNGRRYRLEAMPHAQDAKRD
jgi:hypothetical protein